MENRNPILLCSSTPSFQMVCERLQDYQQVLSENGELEADLISVQLPDIKLHGRTVHSAQIRYTKKAKFITLSRFLVSKLVFQPDRVERIDILMMYESTLVLQDLALKQEGFRQKFGSSLEELSKILKSFTLKPKTTNFDVRKLGSQIKEKIPSYLIPERNLKQVYSFVRTMYYVTKYTPSGVLNKLLPPKAYIGKGYTDKGTARDPAFDGSPSWQAVAQFYGANEEYE